MSEAMTEEARTTKTNESETMMTVSLLTPKRSWM